ncbi:MAG: hypothetical protein UHI81_11450 [Olegusella sp.]|nr:hypothetical protein [Olegusella sp.]
MALSDKARATIAAALANTSGAGQAAGQSHEPAKTNVAATSQVSVLTPDAGSVQPHRSLFPAADSQPIAEVRYVDGKPRYICNCETCRQMRAQQRIAREAAARQHSDADIRATPSGERR